MKARLATVCCDAVPSSPELFAHGVKADVVHLKILDRRRNIRAD
ncbi:MAG: hypothetical protein WCK08_20545 [Betaproteobacteria bacterium]